MMDSTPGKPLRVYNSRRQWQDYSTDEIFGRKLNEYEGWNCAAGTRNLFINPDGDVLAAACGILGRLGNVFESFEIPKTWTKCTIKRCSCGADLFIPKAKDSESQGLLRRTNGQSTEILKRQSDMTEFVAMERTHSSTFKQVYWEIGRRCNFDCFYCTPRVHNNFEAHKSLESLIEATEKVLTQFAFNDKVNFIISGGEPTINPGFMDWASWISERGHHLSMHSNGSRLADYYKKLIHFGDLNISVHFEFWNHAKTLKNIAAITEEKVSLNNKGVGHLEIKVMMPPGRREETLKFEDELRAIPHFKNYCTWAVVPVRNPKSEGFLLEGYTPEDFALFGDRR